MHLCCKPMQIRGCLVTPAGGGWHPSLARGWHLSLAPQRSAGSPRCQASVVSGWAQVVGGTYLAPIWGGWHLVRDGCGKG